MRIKKQLMILIVMISLNTYANRFETSCVKDVISDLSGNVHFMLNNDNNTLEIGKEYDEIAKSKNGAIFNYHISFNVKNISDIYQFNLSNANFKDYILIRVNDHYVWSSNGKNSLVLDNSKMIEESIRGRHLDEEFKFYTMDGASVETWKWHSSSLYIDVKPYVKTGYNKIDITLASGINGGFKITFNLSQKAEKDIKCQDGYKICSSSGERIVDGVRVSRDCWQKQYEKTCDYPSKNDCGKYADCAVIADRECLLKDKYGNCVNIKREMSCEKPETEQYNVDLVDFDLRDKNSSARLVCINLPCIDGGCVNQDSDKNKEMMEMTSKLSAVGKAKDGHLKAEIFKGVAKYCNNTKFGYHNCCKMSGWGRYLGAQCSSEEEELAKLKKENKCIYVGNIRERALDIIHTKTRNAYCCYPTILDKLIQQQGRGQLGKTFGTGAQPDCGGFAIEEILKLDFDKMDFSDFYADILKRMKLPKVGDMDTRLKNSMPSIKTYDPNTTDQENKKAGFNKEQINNLKNEEYAK